MIVEDDNNLREELKLLLSENDYDVFTASNGKEALQILYSEHIDLILSDIIMPDMNGFELFNEIQKNKYFSILPFVFLTARSSYDEFRRGMELGIDDYITKPIVVHELLHAIKTRLRKKERVLKKILRKENRDDIIKFI